MKFSFTSILTISACLAFGYAVSISKEADGRISGTPTVANPGQFPFVASIHENNSPTKFLCGGSIISVAWILTAASCVSPYVSPMGKVLVRVGGVQHGGSEPGRDEILVNQIQLHTNFNPPITGISFNIALLHLQRNIVFNSLIQPAPVASPTKPLDMTAPAIVAGWGGSKSGSSVSLLQFDPMFLLENLATCESDLGIPITSNAICTNGTSTNPDTCVMDMGGPLLQFDATLGMVLYGVISFSTCSNNYTIYESVIDNRDWIYSISGV